MIRVAQMEWHGVGEVVNQKLQQVDLSNTDGTTDYLTVAGHSDLDLGTGNFTIEGYFNSDKNTNSTIICSNN